MTMKELAERFSDEAAWWNRPTADEIVAAHIGQLKYDIAEYRRALRKRRAIASQEPTQ
jgi:hypothetical protein